MLWVPFVCCIVNAGHSDDSMSDKGGGPDKSVKKRDKKALEKNTQLLEQISLKQQVRDALFKPFKFELNQKIHIFSEGKLDDTDFLKYFQDYLDLFKKKTDGLKSMMKTRGMDSKDLDRIFDKKTTGLISKLEFLMVQSKEKIDEIKNRKLLPCYETTDIYHFWMRNYKDIVNSLLSLAKEHYEIYAYNCKNPEGLIQHSQNAIKKNIEAYRNKKPEDKDLNKSIDCILEKQPPNQYNTKQLAQLEYIPDYNENIKTSKKQTDIFGENQFDEFK